MFPRSFENQYIMLDPKSPYLYKICKTIIHTFSIYVLLDFNQWYNAKNLTLFATPQNIGSKYTICVCVCACVGVCV